MEGYILINEKGQRLTYARQWSGIAEGRVWTEKERDTILLQCFAWTFKPTQYQPAQVVSGHVVTTGLRVDITR